MLTFYGLGTIIGAGIYVLIGKVAGEAGIYAPFSFLLAGIIAIFTAFSYAELVSRFPKSAAAAIYVEVAWHKKNLSRLVGLLVIFTGIISAATMANGFVGYLQIFVDVPRWLVISGLIAFLSIIAAWGITQTAILIMAITLLEVGGLFFVLYTGYNNEVVNSWETIFALPDAGSISAIALGGFLAFYAFIGFEDMANVAEEVKNPRRTVPRAIILSVLLSTFLYIAVVGMAVHTMPIDQLSTSEAPLADMVAHAGYSPTMIGLISLVAVINGALVQLIMASRVIYGMGMQKMAPKVLASVNRVTQTPLIATALVAIAILIFALWLPLITLAKLTSLIMLIIYTLVNIALVVIKRRHPYCEGAVCYPIWIPLIGSLVCIGLIGMQLS